MCVDPSITIMINIGLSGGSRHRHLLTNGRANRPNTHLWTLCYSFIIDIRLVYSYDKPTHSKRRDKIDTCYHSSAYSIRLRQRCLHASNQVSISPLMKEERSTESSGLQVGKAISVTSEKGSGVVLGCWDECVCYGTMASKSLRSSPSGYLSTRL